MTERVNAGLMDIFNTILKDHQGKAPEGNSALPPIIVLHGNGNVIAPGGTVHMVQGEPSDPNSASGR